MKIFQDHRWSIATGFILTLVLVFVGVQSTLAHGGHYEPISVDLLVRWAHIIAGITWIGLLYYFNLVQVPSMAGLTAETKADIFKEGSIVRRALFWFRWGAMFTLIFGLILMAKLGAHASTDIKIGAAFGIIMWANVLFVIWPAQKKVIGMVEATAEAKLAAGKRALIASRTNTILSIPMLFFMASSAHFNIFN